MTAIRIDGKAMAEVVRNEVAEGVARLKAEHGSRQAWLSSWWVKIQRARCMFEIK